MVQLTFQSDENGKAPSGFRPRLANAGYLGAAALIVLVLLVGAGFVFASRAERDNRRTELISDALWVEQALRFAVANVEGEMDRLASDIRRGLPREAAAAQMEQLHRLHPELARIALTDLTSGVILAVPPSEAAEGSALAAAESVVLAVKLGEKQFGPAYAEAGQWRFDVAFPAGTQDGRRALLASFTINGLLKESIPWWVAQKNHVAVLDAGGQMIGTKSSVQAAPSAESHIIPFDPPGRGLVIKVTRYTAPAQWIAYALPATVTGLAAIVGASILLLQANVRRRQKAEEQLRAESALRRSMEDALTVGMRARDRDGRIIYANQAFCEMTGWRRDELIGQAPPMPYWDSDHIEETIALHDRILEGRGPKEGFEIRFRRKDGEPLDALIYEAPLYDADGGHVGWMASILDVTESNRISDLTKKQGEELARTARIVSMGEMASTLAHEINQPLAAISTYASGLSEQIRTKKAVPASASDVLAKLSAQALRAGDIVRHLREFTRRSQPKLETIDLAAVAAKVSGFVEPDLARAGIVLEFANGAPCPVKGDPVLLEQVIFNLVRNASEAVGTLPKRRRRIEMVVFSENGQAVLTVRDHGGGIAPGMADKLFTPFVSSKADGMGMGLNICRSIVELHGGRIWSEPANPGCTFRFSIPQVRP